MKLILQRVSRASVTVNNSIVGKINSGLLILLGFAKDDTQDNFKAAIDKVANIRIFSNAEGRFDQSALDLEAEILLVPQFTLLADTSKGRRPEFFDAMEPSKAKEFFLDFVKMFQERHPLKIETGEFGADMKVELLNDGPVTISLEF
jgi:D-tyrosyl-tRNA(Tyr) deacylase